MKTVEAVKGNWQIIFKHYGLPPITGNKHYELDCPICGKKGKFRIDNNNDNGTYICVCGAGSGWELLKITQKKDFQTLAKEIDVILNNDSSVPAGAVANNDLKQLRKRTLDHYASLPNLKGTQGEQYLRSRKINILPPAKVRFDPALGKQNQELFALATDEFGAACYLHRTLLRDGEKAVFESGASSKRLLALRDHSYLTYAKSVAIRLYPVAETLGIGEGLETALSGAQIAQCNVWSVINTAFMKRFRVPAGVRELIIFTDSDKNGAGHAAAFECAHKNLMEKNDLQRVSVRWPAFGDFNNQLFQPTAIYQWRFSR